jgi:hypothetical protein
MTKTSYAFRRGREWICAPAGHDRNAAMVPGLTVAPDLSHAWRCDDLDAAHERQALLRIVMGWSTEIRAVR